MHLAGERVRVRARRAPRPDPERMHAVLVARSSRRARPSCGSRRRRTARAALAGADHLVVPRDDLLRRVHAGADVDDRRRVERVEEELLRAVPHDAHRLAGRDREPRRLDRLLRRALAAEARRRRYGVMTRTFSVGSFSARATCVCSGNGVCVLAHTVTFPSAATAATAECVSIGACATYPLRYFCSTTCAAAFSPSRDVAAFRDRAAVGRGLLEVREDGVIVECRRRRAVRRLHELAAPVRLVAMLVQHGDELAVTDHADARHRPRRLSCPSRRAGRRAPADARSARATRRAARCRPSTSRAR